MTAGSPATLPASDFRALAPLLAAIAPDALHAARKRLAGLDRETLTAKFRAAFTSGKRTLAFTLAVELTSRQIPPCLRHDHLSSTDYTIHQKADLTMYDFQWLRHEYPEHERQIRFKRCKGLFVGSETLFHNAAEFALYRGTRPAWKIVKSLSLTEQQQLDCFWLQSAPIAKRREAAKAMRGKVFKALQEDLNATRRTKTFTDDDAKAALFRRHRLWICRGLTTGSASAIAKKYTQLVGANITPQIVTRQLQIVDETLRKSRSSNDEK